MSGTYSSDLREKVISHIMSGCSKRETAKLFKIGEATIYNWLRLYKAGSLSAKQRQVWPRKVDAVKLREYVALHDDHTLKEIGQALGVSFQVVSSWLRRLQITRKKRPRSIKSATKASVLHSKVSLPT